MEIKRDAVAGTLESSDIMITVRPGNGKVNIDLNSSVSYYYGESILSTINEVVNEMSISSVEISAVDHGALDCTIRARVTTALRRASEVEL